MSGFPVLHYLPEFVQTHAHSVSDAMQTSHSPSPTSPHALNLSQHQGLLLKLQLQHQSFQKIFRVYFL